MQKVFSYMVIREKSDKYKRSHTFCQFNGEYKEDFIEWLNENKDKLIKKYGEENLLIKVFDNKTDYSLYPINYNTELI